jgi:hypothetical protein
LNEELRVYAATKGNGSGADITIGLAAPRKLVPAGHGAWRAAAGGALTVRVADDGAGLLVSVPGAHHLAFSRVADDRDIEIPRGLRAVGS